MNVTGYLTSSRSPRGLARLKGITALGLALACAGPLAADQLWVPAPRMTKERLEPGPGEITLDKAVEACRAYFPKVGLNVPAGIPTAERPARGGKRDDSVILRYATGATLYVDVTTGDVTGYADLHRMTQGRRRAPPPGPLRINDVLSAQNYVWGVIERIGLPNDFKLVSLDCRFASVTLIDRKFDPPSVDAAFERMPFGYPFENRLGRRSVWVDPADGLVVMYIRAPDTPYTIESRSCVLKLSEAKAKAEPLVKKYAVGVQPMGGVEGPAPTRINRLMWVHPNGENGGIEYDEDEKPTRLRLAWVLLYPLNDEIWIDAADGKVLGGRCFGQMDYPKRRLKYRRARRQEQGGIGKARTRPQPRLEPNRGCGRHIDGNGFQPNALHPERSFPVIQILTVEDILAGHHPGTI